MAKTVCRISWRKGQPLGLLTYPAPTFLQFPREVRYQIYEYALISPDPVLVWVHEDASTTTESYESTYLSSSSSSSSKNSQESSSTVDSLPSEKSRHVVNRSKLATSLMWCNKIVAAEAEFVFYSENTLRFRGHGTWDAVYSFLHHLKPNIRGLIPRILIEIKQPLPFELDEPGRFKRRWWERRVLPRHRYEDEIHWERVPGEVAKGGVVSPAIEACFRIMNSSGPPQELILDLRHFFLPAMQLEDNPESPKLKLWCLEFPNLIETFRQDFTLDRVSVVWKGTALKEVFDSKREQIEKAWGILDARPAEGHAEQYVGMCDYTLRSRILIYKDVTGEITDGKDFTSLPEVALSRRRDLLIRPS